MDKCYKCGQEFEGNFCPKCGTKYEAEKICPECGASLNSSVNFCNHCGHRFETYENNTVTSVETKQRSFEFGDRFYRVLSKTLKWTPCVLFLLFAVLNFVYMSCSAYSGFGFDMGNVYKLSDGDYPVSATIIIVVASVSTALALAYPLLVGKFPKVAHILTFVMYLGVLTASSILYVNIKDGGWTVGAAAKLLISFAVVFAVFSAFILIADVLLSKRSEKYFQAKTAPVNNGQPTFMQKVAYKAKTWYGSHRKATNGAVIGVCSVAVVCALVFGLIVPYATNIFRANKLAKLNIGDSKEQVVKRLGKPYGGDTESNTWTYYGNEFIKLYKQQEELNKKVENLTDFEQLGQLMQQQAALDEKINSTTGRVLNVSFNTDGNLTSLTYDAAYCKTNFNANKEVKNITVGNKNTVDVLDISNNTVNVKITYTDGSYKLSALPTNVKASNFGTVNKNFPSTATLAWKDTWGEYTQDIKVDESNFNFEWNYDSYNKVLTLDGQLPSKQLYSFFDIEQLPWQDKEITSVVIGQNVQTIPKLSSLIPNFSGTVTVSSSNPNFMDNGGIIIDSNDNILYIPYDADVELITKTQWYNSLSDGLVYFDDVLIGYKGKMPENYSLSIRDGTTVILDKTIYNSYNLKSVTIPDSVQSIGSYAFQDCSNIEQATIPASAISYIPETNLKKVVITSGESIGSDAFYGCSNLTTVTIGNSVTTIGNNAFYNCSNLTEVNYTGTIADWCNISFGYSDANPLNNGADLYINGELVTELIIPEGVTEIKSNAFYGCTSITSVTIPNSVTRIGNYAFHGCSNLTTVTIGNSVQSIGYEAFEHCYNLTNITIPDSVTTIGSYAFRNCDNLTKVNYTGTIADWCNISFSSYDINPLCNGADLFINGELVTELIIPEGVTEIKDYAFYDCTSITSVTIGNSVKSIGRYAFNGCSNLTSVIIPDSVTTIGSSAFSDCSNLTKVNFTGTIADWCNISFSFVSSNPLYNGADLYINDKLVTELIIPEGVTEIKDYAFYDCTSITSVTIGNSVTTIGSSAFSDCSNLTSITIGNSVKSIPWQAFYKCSNLTTVTIPDSVTTIDEYAFA